MFSFFGFVKNFVDLFFNNFLCFQGDFSISGLGEKARSTDFSSGKSDSKYKFFIIMLRY